MLIVRIKEGEPIFIGEAKVIIHRETGRFKVGVEAPPEIPIERGAVREARLNRESNDREFGGGS